MLCRVFDLKDIRDAKRWKATSDSYARLSVKARADNMPDVIGAVGEKPAPQRHAPRGRRRSAWSG
jgi:hypothetical protein